MPDSTQPQGESKITILVAEDEEPLRNLVDRILRRHDRYVLLLATDGQDALCVAQQHQGKIHLLLSNVQMPGMTGSDLARELRKSRPELRVMLMSGYPQGVLMLDHGWMFLQKPFLPSAFVETIEKALN